MIIKVNKTFILKQYDGEDIQISKGSELNFIDTTYYFYHAYYESHNYRVLFNLEEKPLEIRFHRVHGNDRFQLMSCCYPNDNKKVMWRDVFEEDCPLSVT